MKSENIRVYILIRFKLRIEALMIHKELKKAVRAHATCLKNIYNCINEFKKKNSLANSPRPGRPITGTSSINIARVKALIDNEPSIA